MIFRYMKIFNFHRNFRFVIGIEFEVSAVVSTTS